MHYRNYSGKRPDDVVTFCRRAAWLSLLSVSLLACDSTQQRGIATADRIVLETGIKPEEETTLHSELAVGRDFRDSDFSRKIKEAVLSFPSLAGQQAQIQTAVAQMDTLVGSLRPQVSSGFGAQQTLIGDGDGSSVNLTVTARQLVFDGAATRNQIAQTKIGQLRLSFELDQLLNSLSGQMALAWLDLWEQQELRLLAQKNVQAHEQFVEQTRIRVRSGVATQSDLLSAQSRLADVRASLAQAQSAVGQARAGFVALIGPVPPTVQFPPELPSLDPTSARQRISTSSQMAVVKLDLSSAISQRDVIVSRRYPSVFLELNGTGSSFDDDDEDNDVSIGFSVDQSLFSGGQQDAREREAESQIVTAERIVDEADRQLKSALETAIANREAVVLEVSAAKDAARSNFSNLSAIREQFATGRRGIIDILDAQRDLSAALAREVTARSRQIQVELEVLSLTGDLAAVFGIQYDPHAGVLNGQVLSASPSTLLEY